VVLKPTTPAAEFAALDLTATVTSVTIASPPVVNFKLATKQGVPVIGFGSTSKSSTATVAGYPNLAFSLAKLVPGSGGAPSKWVNYIVTTVPTFKSATDQTIVPAAPTRPTTDNTGTLVDNGDGTYKYTFYRDVPGIKAQVDAMTVTAPNNKAALGDLTYNPALTHRLTIQISGNAPGTGTNTPNGVQVVTGVPLQKPVDVIFDFVPATGQTPAASANRKMVDNANCESCHSTLGGLPNGDGASLDFHGGARNNIEYCVICHTDQRAYGRTEVAACPQPTGTACYNTTTRSFEQNGASSAPSTYLVDGRTVGNAPNFLHKIHVGGSLTKTNYNYGGVAFDKGGYSQDIRNCEKCHNPANTATPQATQWKDNPNRLACGSCHDGINFDTGVGLTLADKAEGLSVSTGYFGAAHPQNALDGTCSNAACHGAGGGGDPELVHRPVTPPNKGNFLNVADGSGNNNTNAAWIASNLTRLPAGAIKVTYVIKSVSRNATTGFPEMVFQMQQNGVAVDLQDFATAAVNPATGKKEIWANFMGAPSLYWVFAVPQDNVSKPVDFNASLSIYLRCLWDGTAGTADCGTTGATATAGSATPSTVAGTLVKLTGADAGYYKATLNRAVPANAVMLTGGMGYSYGTRTSLPLTQTNLPAYPVSAPLAPIGTTAETTTSVQLYPKMPNMQGGLIVIAPNKQVVATGYTGRRAIVEDARCNNCHQELGTFTEDAFHAGQRNDGTTCSWCHTPNRPNQGWSVDSTYFIHAIHGSAKRTAKFTYDATSATTGFYDIKYPGVLARCEQCHVPGSYDFANAASADAVGLGADGIDKRLFRTVATGTYASTSTTSYMFSPYVLLDNAYGSGPSYSGATGTITDGAATTLVMSPTVTVCASCHDTAAARSHMESNGGSFYRARSPDVFGGTWPPATKGTAPVNRTEQCVVCHSSGKVYDTKAVHAR
jgi:OmcA/MtrC family decaheme c-type cytochrome